MVFHPDCLENYVAKDRHWTINLFFEVMIDHELEIIRRKNLEKRLICSNGAYSDLGE